MTAPEMRDAVQTATDLLLIAREQVEKAGDICGR
jgi:hypothetical protein